MDFFEWRARHGQELDSDLERLAAVVIDAAPEVHRHLGPGLPEKSYEEALSHELALRQIPHACQAEIEISYKDKRVGKGWIDILVDRRLIVELKAVDQLTPTHRAQVVTYLTITDLNLGLLINFNVALLKDGLKRVIRTR